MSVIRIEKNKNYTTMSNYHFKEKEMSLKAKGLLSLMLSLPNDWDYTIAGLVSICKENETAVKSALNELKQFGYLKIIKNKPTEENGGRISYDYIVYEKPIQEDKKQELENLYVENQDIENQRQLNTKQLNINNTNIDKSILDNNVEKAKIKDIIDYLNKSTNSNYRYDTKGTISLIKARFKEGYTVDDFYTVIDKKVKEWNHTEFAQYLRPSTLFGNKFENYLNQKQYFNGKAMTKYSSKSSFDNTANHYLGNPRISDEELDKMTFEEKKKYIENMESISAMTPRQREFFNTYCLARDENGNLRKF